MAIPQQLAGKLARRVRRIHGVSAAVPNEDAVDDDRVDAQCLDDQAVGRRIANYVGFSPSIGHSSRTDAETGKLPSDHGQNEINQPGHCGS